MLKCRLGKESEKRSISAMPCICLCLESEVMSLGGQVPTIAQVSVEEFQECDLRYSRARGSVTYPASLSHLHQGPSFSVKPFHPHAISHLNLQPIYVCNNITMHNLEKFFFAHLIYLLCSSNFLMSILLIEIIFINIWNWDDETDSRFHYMLGLLYLIATCLQ